MAGYRTTVLRHKRTPAVLGGAPAFSAPIYVTRPRLPNESDLFDLIRGLLRSRWLTNDGALVRALEERLRSRLGAGFCAAICNGTTALQVALRSLGIDGEVITTPFTFPATVHAITWMGLTPVFCDIDPASYNIDADAIDAAATGRSRAVLPVHVFGNPCDVNAIERVTARHGLRTVYDCAHAFGVSYRGRPITDWGDLSILSLHATKLFHTVEGGAIVGRTAALLERVALLRNFGIVNEEEVRGIGINGKLSELHAAMGLAMLPSIDDEIAQRRQLTERYLQRIDGIPGIRLQRFPVDMVRNYAYFTIEVDTDAFGLSRDQLHKALRAENIMVRKYFSPLASANHTYRDLPTADPSYLPNAHRLSTRILSLPLYGDLQLDDVDRIIDAVLALQAAASGVRRTVSTGQ